jgi:hypothetical protein
MSGSGVEKQAARREGTSLAGKHNVNNMFGTAAPRIENGSPCYGALLIFDSVCGAINGVFGRVLYGDAGSLTE